MVMVSLIGSTVPVTAQASLDPSPGPIARAITREAIRYAAQPMTPADRAWLRVRRLEPGTEVIVTVKGSRPSKRYFVTAVESDLTVLNLADPLLPRAATRVLRDMAAHHPEYLAAPQDRQVFLDNDVSVGPEGVAVSRRKVSDLGQVVEKIARPDVAEMTGIAKTGSGRGAVLGVTAGLAIAGLVVKANEHGGGDRPGALLADIFLGIGLPIAGGIVGYHASGHETAGEVIYRAP